MVTQEALVIHLSSLDASGDMAHLAERARDRLVVVIVPSEAVLTTMVMMPPMTRARLTQALPFALEDQLIADVGSLHFAQGVPQKEKPLPVAIVAHEQMQAWLTLLKQCGVRPDIMIPMAYVLPVGPRQWHIWVGEQVVVRQTDEAGFAVDKAQAPTWIKQAISEATEKPEAIYFYNDAAGEFAQSLALSLPVYAATLPDMATMASKPSVNLLQGPYAIKKSRLPVMNVNVKIAGYLAAAFVFLLFLYPSLSYVMLRQRLHHIDAQINTIYHRQFPQATQVVAPKMRLQEKWAHLSEQRGENRALLWVAKIGKAMLASQSITINQMDFHQSALTLTVAAATSVDFADFKQALLQQGLQVTERQATVMGGRVSATLQVE